MADWNIVISNPPAGATAQREEYAMEDWLDFTVQHNADGVSTSISCSEDNPALKYVHELRSDVLLYRDRVLVHRLRIVDSTDTFTTEGHTVELICLGYDALLERRVLFDDNDSTTAIDQHDLAWNLIEYTQNFEDLGITRAAGKAGQNRRRVIQRGKTIAEAINEIAQQEDGFDWWIDENLQFHAQTPRRLNDLGEDWAWGAEVQSFTRQSAADQYASAVFILGALNATTLPSGNSYPPPTPVLRQHDSMPYGRWESAFSYGDVVTNASLVGKAEYHLAESSTLRPTYSLVLAPGTWTPVVEWGSTFTLYVKTEYRMNMKVLARVESVQVQITADGAENVTIGARAETPEVDLATGLVVQLKSPRIKSVLPSPAGVNAARSSPAGPIGQTRVTAFTNHMDGLAAILQGLSRRIRRQERST